MAFTVVSAHRLAVLTVSGELDISTASELESAVEAACRAQPWLLRLDMRHVTSVDAHGIRAIAASRARLQSHSCSFEIRDPSAPVRSTLARAVSTGLLEEIRWSDTDE